MKVLSTFLELCEYAKTYSKILLYVSAPWCRPCRMIKPVLESYLENKEYEKEKKMIFTIDYDQLQEEEDLLALLKTKKIPTFYIYENGKIVEEKTVSKWDEVEEFMNIFFWKDRTIDEYMSEDF